MADRRYGFTPVFDDVVELIGTTGALVFGVVWRHCQMSKRRCSASVETMARLTGLGERTVRMYLGAMAQTDMLYCIREQRGQSPPWYLCGYTPDVTISKDESVTEIGRH